MKFWKSVKEVLTLYRYQVILLVVVPATIAGMVTTWGFWEIMTHRAALTAGMLAFLLAFGIGFIGALYADFRHSEKRQNADGETWWTEERE